MNPFNSISEDETELKFKKLTGNATTPVRGSRYAAGFDLFSAEFKEILPQCRTVVKTDIGVMLPLGTYGRVAPRFDLAVKISLMWVRVWWTSTIAVMWELYYSIMPLIRFV